MALTSFKATSPQTMNNSQKLTLVLPLDRSSFFLFVAVLCLVFLFLLCLAVQTAVDTAANKKSGYSFSAILVSKQCAQ